MSQTNSKAFQDAASVWNQRFTTDSYLFGTEANQWLQSQKHHLAAGQRVLCVADGEGRNSVWLAAQGLHVEAFDVSDVGVSKALALAQQRQVQVSYTVSDCDQFAWPSASYDAVAAIFVQFATPDMRRRLFEHIRQSLKPGGLLLLQGYTPKQIEYKTGGPGIASHLYTEPLLREELSAFELLQVDDYEAELQEGSGHAGMSALIGVVARRL